MSFDTTFDYSAGIENLNNAVNYYNVQLTACNTNLSMYTGIVGYADLTASPIATLTSQQTSLQNTLTILQAVLTEITNLTSSPDPVKVALYQNFVILGCDLLDFMKRMLFNFETALADPDLIALLADTVNTTSAKNALANIIYNRYPIQSQYGAGISLIILPPQNSN
jgi:hypothetical protein